MQKARDVLDERNSDVPLPPPRIIGIIYNLKKGSHSADVPDIEAEYDNFDTVLSIKRALEGGGFTVALLEADAALPEKLSKTAIDLAFNIAEGTKGRGREAQIPALLNMLGIPFVGSDETTLCLALDKALTKRLVASYHIRTPRYEVIKKDEPLNIKSRHFPVIVKPNAEGSSKGISEISIVSSREELRALAKRNIGLYGGDMLAEEYIEGREFTVGILGNGKETRVFPPMEIIFQKETQGSYHVYSYPVKQDYKNYVTYSCPAGLSERELQEMTAAARRIYEILGCRDFARMDFRMSQDGKIYFIEVNPLPGLAPNYSDYPMLAEFCGTDYDTLVLSVLNAAIKRLSLERNAG